MNIKNWKWKLIRGISDESKIILVSTIVYSLVLISLYVYSTFINPGFDIRISDQLNFYNRGVFILNGHLPHVDFKMDAASISPYFWIPIVFISMFITGNFSTDLVTDENYYLNESMMASSYVFRILFAICLIISAVLLYRLEKRENKYALHLSLVYILNPFYLYLFSFWGSDECLLPLLILLPIYLFERGNTTMATSVIIIGVGLKYFPILLAPLIWIYSSEWKERIIQTLYFFIGIILLSLPLLYAPEFFIYQFLNPITDSGNHGILTIIQQYSGFNIEQYNFVIQLITVFSILLAGLFFFLRRKDWNYHKVVVLLVLFLLLYTKIQVSYFAMIIPFTSILVFTKGKLKWTFLTYYIIGISLGVAADYLLLNTQRLLYLEIFSWIEIGLFYLSSILLILYFLFFVKRKKLTNHSEIHKTNLFLVPALIWKILLF